jgi:all-trans-retinol dehydrogenase (NAD+)
MINTNYGHVLNVSSMSAYIPPAGLADYAASKSGIIAFHEVRDTRPMPNPDYETFQ